MIKQTSWQTLPALEINNEHGVLLISRFGGHILGWRPAGQEPVIWTTRCPAEEGKAIRGGVPICWPWFGALEGQVNHGFARTREWQLASSEEDGDSSTVVLTLQGLLSHTEDNPGFDIRQTITLGKELKQTFEFSHQGSAALPFQLAMHSYFQISNPAAVSIKGLENHACRDKLDGMAEKNMPADIRLDRHWDTEITGDGSWELYDEGLQRTIRCSAEQADTTILWHLSDKAAEGFSDIHEGGNREYVCLETASLHAEPLAPYTTASVSQTLSVIKDC